MYTTITAALAHEHVRDMRAQAKADGRARQARQARKQLRTLGGVRHEITARRRTAAARHA
jgi:hypothetical protein